MYKAIEQYNKAIEVDPNYSDAYYNAGVIFVTTMANPSIDSLNSLPLKAPPTLVKSLNDRIDFYYKSAQPYFEKVYALDPKSKLTVTVLGKIYSRFKNKAGQDKMFKALEELEK
jgi:tetratricopeptide (TPR) repeat protein